ncbi:MAG TPA: ABC transporter permease subunit [Micromonosporaceae bacterium]|nr:ABC transporter permease subunit [Micromonosporaceae bacterium]
MSLVRAERRRLLKRRFTRYMLLIGVGVLVAVAVGMFLTNHKVSPATVAAAERAADEELVRQQESFKQFQDDCRKSKESGSTTPKDAFPPDCEDIAAPSRDQVQAEWFMPATFDFRREFEATIGIFSGILALVAFAVGASFVGAEWSSGGMMNLLLWRPRRVRVFATKLGTLLATLLAITLPLAAAWTAAFWAIGTFRGTTAKMTTGTWESFALTGARGLALILVLGTAGFALASLGRHTAMALGSAIGIGVVGQYGLGIALILAQVRYFEAWLLPTYAAAWLTKRVELQDYRSCELVQGQCTPESIAITWQHAGLLFGGGTLLLLLLAAWAMRRRDIT